MGYAFDILPKWLEMGKQKGIKFFTFKHKIIQRGN